MNMALTLSLLQDVDSPDKEVNAVMAGLEVSGVLNEDELLKKNLNQDEPKPASLPNTLRRGWCPTPYRYPGCTGKVVRNRQGSFVDDRPSPCNFHCLAKLTHLLNRV